jgi:cell division protein FtsL
VSPRTVFPGGSAPRCPAARSSRPVLPHLGRVAALVLVAGLVGIFHVWSRTRVVAEGYRLAEVQQEHSRLASEQDRLRLEVEALRAPRSLEAYARTRLGMAPPDPGPVWAGRASGGDDHLSGPAEPALFSPRGVPRGTLAALVPGGGATAPAGARRTAGRATPR